jgi:hypothetical protein
LVIVGCLANNPNKSGLLFTLPLQNLSIMKYVYFFIAIALLSASHLNSKGQSSESIISSESLTNNESEYLKTRDAYIEQFKSPQKVTVADSLYKMTNKALSSLEVRLREILKDSKYSGQGKINLETLISELGFGMLDGLWFEKDSMRIFYTSKNLFLKYFNANQIEGLIPENLDAAFQSAFFSDAFVLDFSHIKITSAKSTEAYGVVGLAGQMPGPFPPQHLFAFASTDKYIYLIDKYLKTPIKELPQCKSEWSIINAEAEKLGEQYRAANLKDTTALNKWHKLDELAFSKYCECYQKELTRDPRFKAIQKQLKRMVKYLEP